MGTSIKYLLLFVAGIAVGSAHNWWLANAKPTIRNGSVLFSHSESEVMALSLATPKSTTTAQRSKSNDPFVVQTTFTDGRPARQCIVSASLAGHINQLSDLIVHAGIPLNQRERAYPYLAGSMYIQTRMLVEPSNPVLLFVDGKHEALAAIADGLSAEVTLKPAELDWLANPCK